VHVVMPGNCIFLGVPMWAQSSLQAFSGVPQHAPDTLAFEIFPIFSLAQSTAFGGIALSNSTPSFLSDVMPSSLDNAGHNTRPLDKGHKASFVRYMTDIGRRYRNRDIELISICLDIQAQARTKPTSQISG